MAFKFFRTPVGLLLLGAFLGELFPEGFDFLHFWLQKYILTHALSKTVIILLNFVDWYFLSASWYLILLLLALVLHIRKVKTIKIISIVGSIVGFGAVVGFILFWFYIP